MTEIKSARSRNWRGRRHRLRPDPIPARPGASRIGGSLGTRSLRQGKSSVATCCRTDVAGVPGV